MLVTNYASDPDWPAQNLTFSFETNAPAGATINATNGAFAWTPSEEQGPGTNVVKIIVTDNGSPPLSNRLSFTVTVLESNRPPVLAPVPDLMVMKGRGLSWTNSATDADWPPQSVTFSLGTNTLAGAVVNPTNGVFAWTPAMNQGPATNLITVIVSDNGPPPLSDSRTFTVIVLETNRPPILEPLQDVTVIEGKLLLITNRASDVDWPPQLLTYTLDTNAPAGAVINAVTKSGTNQVIQASPNLNPQRHGLV